MRVLVTGGAGFLGSYVVRELKTQGFTPIVFDRPYDVRDMSEAPKADAVIHLAGVLGTAELFDRFDEAVDVNVKGTQRVLDYCLKHDASFVGIEMPRVWANVYQATKQCASILTTAWHESFGLPVCHVRAYNLFGPGQKFGGDHPQKIIPTFATRAWKGEDIPIWGDGQQTVDLVHVEDTAKVLVDCLAFGNDETIDAGTREQHTVLDIARTIKAMCGSSSEIVHLPMRDGERPHTRIAATGEGWDALGWHPTFSVDRLQETVESYR